MCVFYLSSTDRTAEIGLSAQAELAFAAFGGVERNDMVAGTDISDTFTDGFDDTSTFVTENNGEQTLRICIIIN